MKKRDRIISITPKGGFGYVHCLVRTNDGEYFISEECEAGMLMDWAKKALNNGGQG